MIRITGFQADSEKEIEKMLKFSKFPEEVMQYLLAKFGSKRNEYIVVQLMPAGDNYSEDCVYIYDREDFSRASIVAEAAGRQQRGYNTFCIQVENRVFSLQFDLSYVNELYGKLVELIEQNEMRKKAIDIADEEEYNMN